MPNPLATIVLVCPRHKLRLVHSNTLGSGEMFSCPSAGCPVACSVGSAIVDAQGPAAQRRIPVADPCAWEALVDEIDEMLDGGAFDWARDTLEGIRTTVSDREHVTDRQAEAVRNIAEKCR
jgi:hypothetical protein